MPLRRRRQGGDVCAIYVHAGAGFHSYANEHAHLTACQDAANVAFALLKNGGSALDAVEMAVKVFEDREITNAGYGSNLCMDGMVECDATIVDHYGQSGAAGAVSMVKNPIGLARLILDETTRPLSLERVPPNLLVGAGATAYAEEMGLLTVSNDRMVSPGAREKWIRWKSDLEQYAEGQWTSRSPRHPRQSNVQIPPPLTDHGPGGHRAEISPPISPPAEKTLSAFSSTIPSQQPLVSSTTDVNNIYHSSGSYAAENMDQTRSAHLDGSKPPTAMEFVMTSKNTADPVEQGEPVRDQSRHGSLTPSANTPTSRHLSAPTPSPPHSSDASMQSLHGQPDREDLVVDTVGAIAVDCFGNVAAGSSSGGIGMKHRGRCGPAALVGVGTAVMPVDPDDQDETSVAVVTSGTGEHIATTLAAATCADRIYSSVRKVKGSELESCTEDEAMHSVIAREFMNHPGVKGSHCAGAIGIMAVKKTRDGVMLLFGHNTDSFALANMQSLDRKPSCVMSRNNGQSSIAQGGRYARYGRGHQGRTTTR